MLKETFEVLLREILSSVHEYYGDRLVSLAVFGSVARGTQRPDSDVDLLVVCHALPPGRTRRIAEFGEAEKRLEPVLSDLRRQGISTDLSTVLKTPAEVEQGGLFYLDLVEDARLLYDRGDFLKGFLDRLHGRLQQLGAQRIHRGNAWYWDLKPDFKPGDIFEL
ncbi:MAG: nucleotidyltransferase family protein [Candidatus Binatia bacterium]